MSTGIIKFYNAKKAYGFILEDDTNKEIFVHQSGLIDRINKGDKVTFETIEDDKGVKAINVKKS